MEKCFKISHKKMKFLLFSIGHFYWELSTYFESILFLVNCVLFNFVMEFKSSSKSSARYTKKNDHLGIWKYGWVSQHHNIFTNCGSHCFDMTHVCCVFTCECCRCMVFTRPTSGSSSIYLDVAIVGTGIVQLYRSTSEESDVDRL